MKVKNMIFSFEMAAPAPSSSMKEMNTALNQTPPPIIRPSSIPQPLAKFHIFGKLPLELRRTVWKHTLPGPRRLSPHERPASRKQPPHGCSLKSSSIRAPTQTSPTSDGIVPAPKIPTALSICHESRKEAQRYYQLAFGVSSRDFSNEDGIYIDFTIDEFYFLNIDVWFSTFARTVNVRDMQKVQNIRLEYEILSDNDIESFPNYQGLKEVSVNFDPPLDPNDEIDVAVSAEGMEEVLEKFEEVKESFPDWEVPKLTLSNRTQSETYFG